MDNILDAEYDIKTMNYILESLSITYNENYGKEISYILNYSTKQLNILHKKIRITINKLDNYMLNYKKSWPTYEKQVSSIFIYLGKTKFESRTFCIIAATSAESITPSTTTSAISVTSVVPVKICCKRIAASSAVTALSSLTSP